MHTLVLAMHVVVAGFTFGSTARAEDSRSFTSAKTSAGLTFHYRFDDSTPFAVVSFGMNDNFAAATPGKEGFPELAGSMVMQGADGAGQAEFIERLNDLAAGASVSLGSTQMTGSVRAPAATLADAMAMVAATLKAGAPSQKTLARLKSQAKSGLAQSEQRAETIVQRAALRLILGRDHPAIRALDRDRYDRVQNDDLAEWRRRVLDKAKLHVVVSGKIAQADAARIIDQAFGDLPERLAPIAITWPQAVVPSRTIVIERETPQSAVLILGATRIEPGPDATIASVANAVLGSGSGSRLWTAVRAELGATYGAGAGLLLVDPTQRLVTLRAAVANDLVKASVDAMRKGYATWWETGATAAEVGNVASRFVNEFRSTLTDPGRTNSAALGVLLVNRPLQDFATYESRVRALTTETLNRSIQALFPSPTSLLTVIVTPKADGLGADCVIKSAEEIETCRR